MNNDLCSIILTNEQIYELKKENEELKKETNSILLTRTIEELLKIIEKQNVKICRLEKELGIKSTFNL